MVTQKVAHCDWSPELVAEFAPSVAANPWGFGEPLEVLQGCHAFEYQSNGQRALIAVRPVARQAGTRLDVVGLVSTGNRLNALEFDAALMGIAAQFSAAQLAMTTLRPHIANQAKRSGWIQSGVLMIKPINRALQ